jgi:predicted N-acetyltransferase YhbS
VAASARIVVSRVVTKRPLRVLREEGQEPLVSADERIGVLDPSSELDALVALLDRAYGPGPRRARVLRMLAVDPTCVIVLREGGEIRACSTFVAYPDGGFGWVGLVATLPEHERRGLGRRLTEAAIAALKARGCAPVLDASDKGAPLYPRMGFHDAGLARTLVADDPDATLERARKKTARRASAASIEEVAHLDREAFGADRSALLAVMHARLAVRDALGAVTGFLCLHEGAIGPVVARDAETLHALVASLPELASGASISVPPETESLDAWKDLGFREVRTLRHMRRELAVLPGHRAWLAAMASYAEG